MISKDVAFVARRNREKGVALIIVLSCLVLLSTLVVGFLSSVTNENAAAKIYAAGVSTRFLSDSAVNVVMGQIAEATKGVSSDQSTRMSWASQPGMIHTYDDKGGIGSAYKLYSSGRMVIPGANAKAEMKADVPIGWEKQPALYTDLNAPVADASQNLHFPILNGNVKQITVNGKAVLTYDADNDGVPDIEGFGIDPASVPNYHGGQPSADNNPAAMPAQWIYVLKDGTLVSPDSGADLTATFSGANQPTRENPITGRIAFWSDDESSKLNINTASEGIDTTQAHTNSPMEFCNPNIQVKGLPKPGFMAAYPARAEYNRYPGHPATTCLSVALQKWIKTSGNYVTPNAYTSQTSDNQFLPAFQQYFALTPRVAFGGSQAGTVAPIGAQDFRGFWGSAVPSDTDRLYTSVDELMFLPSRKATDTLPGVVLDNAALESLRFFLTASSRAAEVTPFNTPKLSMWPQWKTKPDRDRWRGASEGLLEFCSSFGQAPAGTTPSGKFEYFFQRNRAQLSGASKPSFMSSVQDWNEVPRNQELANYLYQLGSKPIPGYGGAFVSSGKYSQNTFNSIIVASLDMIRYNVGSLQFLWPYGNQDAQGTWKLIDPLVVTYGLPGMSASPTASPSVAYKGYGDYPAITQVALGVYQKAPSQLGAYLIFNTFNPGIATGHPGWGRMRIKIDNLDKLGLVGISGNLAPQYVAEEDNNATACMRPYLVNLPGDVRVGGAVIPFGSKDPITISVLDDDQGNVIQKLQVNFPSATMPAPPVISGAPGNAVNVLAGDIVGPPFTSFKTAVRGVECGASGPIRGDWRLLAGTWAPDSTFFQPTNGYASSGQRPQVHKLRMFYWGAGGGDYRGGLANYEQTTGDPAYDAPGKLGKIPATAVSGSLVAGFNVTNYSDFCAPAAPAGLNGASGLNGPGDWDTGPLLQPDGPYINPAQASPRGIDGPPFMAPDKWNFRQINSNNWEANGVDSNTDNGGNGFTFAPNRQVSSAVKFGSLPTGLFANEPWQTLLFCPNPASRTTAATGVMTEHKGAANPPDHVYLEFFTMPTVEPYAISEPLSTAGKVNPNYQLAPFTSIERSTAVRGVLKSTFMKGICGNVVKSQDTVTRPTPVQQRSYKMGSTDMGSGFETCYEINRDATVEGIQDMYFNKGNVFRYASEVCDVFLVPKKIAPAAAYYAPSAAAPPTSYKDMMKWWAGDPLTTMRLTGDNLREEPYDRIYSRLTTKSNTYTVHYRVQILRKRPSTDPNVWQEGVDNVVAESRGSTMIERYVDPSDANLNPQWDVATRKVTVAADLSKLYKFRVISTKKFAP